MRLLTRKIYRAFPELDRFDDDRCRRFVAAALRHNLRTSFHRFLITLAFFAVAVPACIAIILIDRWIFPGSDILANQSLGLWLLWALLCAPLLAAAPIAAFLVRDQLLRRSIAGVIRARGRCAGCGYSLLGIPVADELNLVCPECGLSCEIDPALGELVRDAAGAAHFQPPGDALLPPRFFTPARLKKLRRIALITLIVLIVVPGGLWGGYEIFLHRQALRAAAAIPSPAHMTALAEANQPPGVSPAGENAWDALAAAFALKRQIDSSVYGIRGSSPIAFDFEFIYDSRVGDSMHEVGRQSVLQRRDQAVRMLDQYRLAGLFDQLRHLSTLRRAVMPVPPPTFPGQVWGFPIRESDECRTLSMLNTARMALAAQSGDQAEFVDALESTLSIVRVLSHQPWLSLRLTAIADEGLALNQLRSFLATHPPEPWLAAITQAIARQRPQAPFSIVVDGERLDELAFFAGIFSEPVNVRWGGRSGPFAVLFGADEGPMLGTFDARVAKLRAFSREIDWLTQLDPSQRGVIDATTHPALFADHGSITSADSFFIARDVPCIEHRAIDTMLALELFRARQGRYPAALDELVPTLLPAAPIDPWSGRPLGYRTTDPAAEPKHRPYLLYSTGPDAADNNATDPSDAAVKPFVFTPAAAAPGTDFILNNPDR